MALSRIPQKENLQDLRFVSYDANMLIREHAEQLKICQFKNKEQPEKHYEHKPSLFNLKSNDGLAKKFVSKISKVQVGQRFKTVLKSCFYIGWFGQARNTTGN